jgi:hypothetical protein
VARTLVLQWALAQAAALPDVTDRLAGLRAGTAKAATLTRRAPQRVSGQASAGVTR